jgi:hypothetical protein
LLDFGCGANPNRNRCLEFDATASPPSLLSPAACLYSSFPSLMLLFCEHCSFLPSYSLTVCSCAVVVLLFLLPLVTCCRCCWMLVVVVVVVVRSSFVLFAANLFRQPCLLPGGSEGSPAHRQGSRDIKYHTFCISMLLYFASPACSQHVSKVLRFWHASWVA